MVAFDEFKKLDLRVAQVKSVSEHPNADKLFILQVDVGGQSKQIVAGLRNHYRKEDLIGRKVVVVNNLEPVTLRGKVSDGMILAAVAGEVPVILVPEKDVPCGSLVR